eukprot:2022202-Pleurochrysis_carterae.AAC.1
MAGADGVASMVLSSRVWQQGAGMPEMMSGALTGNGLALARAANSLECEGGAAIADALKTN